MRDLLGRLQRVAGRRLAGRLGGRRDHASLRRQGEGGELLPLSSSPAHNRYSGASEEVKKLCKNFPSEVATACCMS
jgi:hypothetical protein